MNVLLVQYVWNVHGPITAYSVTAVILRHCLCMYYTKIKHEKSGLKTKHSTWLCLIPCLFVIHSLIYNLSHVTVLELLYLLHMLFFVVCRGCWCSTSGNSCLHKTLQSTDISLVSGKPCSAFDKWKDYITISWRRA